MKKKILVVDDFDSIRQFVCETLEKKGYKTLGASNGNQAYEIMLKEIENINLVLTDYNMPGCTGFELLKMLKSNQLTAKVPVIFLTTETNPDKMKAARDAGLSAWIRKPYKADSFFAQIETVISNG